MYETAFGIAALAMRYVFAALIAFILFRLAKTSLAEYGFFRKLRQRQAGSLGHVEVVAPQDSKDYGKVFLLRQENSIGRARRCDIRLTDRGLAPVHAALYERRGKMFLSNYGRSSGVRLNGAAMKRDQNVCHGDLIEMGRMALRVWFSSDG